MVDRNIYLYEFNAISQNELGRHICMEATHFHLLTLHCRHEQTHIFVCSCYSENEEPTSSAPTITSLKYRGMSRFILKL